MDWRYSFGSVHMLYVNTQVNGVNVKAFVDSGAQATISASRSTLFGKLRLILSRSVTFLR